MKKFLSLLLSLAMLLASRRWRTKRTATTPMR